MDAKTETFNQEAVAAGTDGGGASGGPVVEALTGSGASLAGGDLAIEEFGGAGIVVEIAGSVVADRPSEGETDKVDVFEDAVGREADAEAEAGGGIDIFGGGDTFLDDVDGLAKEGHLKTVAELAGAVLLDEDGDFAAAEEEVAGLDGELGGGLGAADDFDEGHQVGRVPEVSREDAFGAGTADGDLRDAEAGGIGGEDGGGRGEAVEFGEEILFEFHVLGHGFDDEGGAGGGGGKVAGSSEARKGGGGVIGGDELMRKEGVQESVTGLETEGGRIIRTTDKSDIKAAEGKGDGDAGTHHAGAEDGGVGGKRIGHKNRHDIAERIGHGHG